MGQHSTLEKDARHKYINGARPLERGTFEKRTPPRKKEMTQVPQKTHNPKGGTKTQPVTFSLRRGMAHERLWAQLVLFYFLLFPLHEAAAGDHAIEVHHCCYLGGLLGGPYVGRGGLGRISKGGCGLHLSFMISFPCLCV